MEANPNDGSYPAAAGQAAGAGAGVGDGTGAGASMNTSTETSQPQAAPKKKKTLIAIIVAILVTLGCGGVAAWALIAKPFAPKAPSQGYSELSEERLNEISANLFGSSSDGEVTIARDIAMDGDITIAQTGEDDAQNSMHFDGVFAKDGNASTTIDFVSDDGEAKIKAVITKGGIYGKVLSSDMGLSEALGDTWYYLSYDTATSMADLDNDVMDVYGCLADPSRGVVGQDEIAQIYQDHPFIKLATDSTSLISDNGVEVYSVEILPSEFSAYVQSLSGNGEVMKKVAQCFGEDYDASDFEFSSDSRAELEEALAELPKMFVGLEGTDVKRVAAELIDDDSGTKITINVRLSYPEQVEVEIPMEYTDFSELLSSFSPMGLGY